MSLLVQSCKMAHSTVVFSSAYDEVTENLKNNFARFHMPGWAAKGLGPGLVGDLCRTLTCI